MSWNQEYIKLYRLSEEVLNDLIPHLSDEEISGFISQRGWLAIPVGFEKDKKESTNRPDPNIYISLNDGISLGIHCNTLASVKRLRSIMLGFYSRERTKLLLTLQQLDKRFMTNVERKIKEHHFSESPSYETEFEMPSNEISESDFNSIFQAVDAIQDESDQRMKERNERWRAVAPVINIACIDIAKDETEFKKILSELRPIYEVVLGIGTPRQIRDKVLRGEAKCPECGATLEFEWETGDIYCSDCDYVLPERDFESLE